MRHRYALVEGCECAAHGGRGVALDDDIAGCVIGKDGSQALQGERGDIGEAARVVHDAEVDVCSQAQVSQCLVEH